MYFMYLQRQVDVGIGGDGDDNIMERSVLVGSTLEVDQGTMITLLSLANAEVRGMMNYSQDGIASMNMTLL